MIRCNNNPVHLQSVGTEGSGYETEEHSVHSDKLNYLYTQPNITRVDYIVRHENLCECGTHRTEEKFI